MSGSIRALALALLVVLAPVASHAAPSGNAVFDRVVEIVNERYYAPADLDKFNATVAAVMERLPELGAAPANSATTEAAVNTVLTSLGVSHTGRYTRVQRDYYELVDVFRGAIRRDARRLFPPDGTISYAGIGIATEAIDGKVFITDVYDGGPAARAALKAGDQIVAVDGAPFEEIASFAGKAGQTATLSIRHTADADPVAVKVQVEAIQPGDAFLKAISDSIRVVNMDGRKIGVVHLWSYTNPRVTSILYDAIGDGPLKDVDGLVLDLRSRWGGAPADAAETFVGRSANMSVVDRDGNVDYVDARFHKPVVAIIDGGTRSGMEVLAYSLKANDVPLVGTETAGDVLAATAFLLPDDSILELAVENVFVAGERLEDNPVQPDIAVPFDVRYANGRDPQFDAAIAELLRHFVPASTESAD